MRTTETRRQRLPVAATIGGVLAVAVVQKSEDVPLPLIFDVFRGSWDDSRGWFRQWRRAENERKQTLRHPQMVASSTSEASTSLRGQPRASHERSREISDQQAIRVIRSGTMHRYTSPGTISDCTTLPKYTHLTLEPATSARLEEHSQVILVEMISILTKREALWCKFWPHELFEAMVSYLLTPGDRQTDRYLSFCCSSTPTLHNLYNEIVISQSAFCHPFYGRTAEIKALSNRTFKPTHELCSTGRVEQENLALLKRDRRGQVNALVGVLQHWSPTHFDPAGNTPPIYHLFMMGSGLVPIFKARKEHSSPALADYNVSRSAISSRNFCL